MAEAESRLQVSTAQLEQAASSPAPAASPVWEEELRAAVAERDGLAGQVERAREERQQSEQAAEALSQEVDRLRGQVAEGRSRFEASVQTNVDQLQAARAENQRLETELEMTRRKFELGSVQQQEQINAELQVSGGVGCCGGGWGGTRGWRWRWR